MSNPLDYEGNAPTHGNHADAVNGGYAWRAAALSWVGMLTIAILTPSDTRLRYQPALLFLSIIVDSVAAMALLFAIRGLRLGERPRTRAVLGVIIGLWALAGGIASI